MLGNNWKLSHSWKAKTHLQVYFSLKKSQNLIFNRFFQLIFPAEFPFKPPSIYMKTPNGRFKPNTRLCLSISDYHPDTWNPAWCVSTILTGLLSFMLEKSPTLGSIETTDALKRRYAAGSHDFNLKDKTFVELFPQIAEKSRAVLNKTSGNSVKNRTISNPSLASSNPDDDPLEASRRQLEHNELQGAENGGANGGGNGFFGAVTNFLVIGGFAAFAFVVQYVIQTVAFTDWIFDVSFKFSCDT